MILMKINLINFKKIDKIDDEDSDVDDEPRQKGKLSKGQGTICFLHPFQDRLYMSSI